MDYDIKPTISQISSMVRSNNIETIQVKKLYCQRQNNSHDCGPFSVLFAYIFCMGLDPSAYIVSQKDLRNNIVKIAMNEKEFSSINLTENPHRIEPKITFNSIVFCVCRNENTAGLKKCEMCKESFHIHCIKIINGICDKCKENEELGYISDQNSTLSHDGYDFNASLTTSLSNLSSLDSDEVPESKDSQISYFKTKNNNQGVSYNGFSYILKRRNKYDTVYICRKSGCECQIKCSGTDVLKIGDIHEHEEDQNHLIHINAINRMKVRAAETVDPIPQIYEDIVAEMTIENKEAASEFRS